MQNFLAGLRGLGRTRLTALAAAGVALMVMLGLFVVRGSTQPNALLYGDLDLAEAAEMMEHLSKAHITASTSQDGASIYVPRDKVASARLLLAKDGLPSGGAVGYELFDKSGTLTSTQFEQSINETRAMEGELERSIRLLHGVRNVRVHLVLPRRDLFASQTSPSQASVVLDIGRSGRMGPDGVLAIQNLVAAAVPGLKTQNISIVDTRGDVLAKPGDPDSAAGQENTLEKARNAEEARLSQAVEDMLIPTLGMGHVRARAAVTMNTDEIHETEETYDPNQQVLRSQQTTTDKSVNTEANTNTSVGNNLPNANANQDNKTGSTNDREEETNNYEIGKHTRVISQTKPRVSRISLAVMVDGAVAPDKNGKSVWHPLEAAEIERIATLAKTAIGYDKSRGDDVQVVSMRFMADGGMSLSGDKESLFSRDTLIYLAEWVVPIVLALGALFIGLRPMLRRGGVQALVEAGGAVSTRLTSGGAAAGGQGELTANEAQLLADDNATVDVDGIEGKLRREAVQKVADRFEDNPEESILLIRSWLEAPSPKHREA